MFFDAPLKWLNMVTLGMSLKVIKLLCVVHGTILGIRMNGHDVIGHVSQALLEYMGITCRSSMSKCRSCVVMILEEQMM